MIYEGLKGTLLTVLHAPTEPPEAPAGSPGSIQVFRAARAFLTFRMISLGLGMGLAALIEVAVFGGLLVAGNVEPGAVVGVAVVLGLTLIGLASSYFLIRLDYDMRYYIVTDRSLRIRQGAVVIQESTYTFANVQNLVIHQGPIERLLGISNLVIQTAGGASPMSEKHAYAGFFHRGVMRGIANATEVRDQILALLKQYRDAGLGDPEDRRRAAATARPASTSAGFSPAALGALREVRDEARALRAALGG